MARYLFSQDRHQAGARKSSSTNRRKICWKKSCPPAKYSERWKKIPPMKKRGAVHGRMTDTKKNVSKRMVKMDSAMARLCCCANQIPKGIPRFRASLKVYSWRV